MRPNPLELMLPLMLLSKPRPNSTFQRYPLPGWAWAVEASPASESATRQEHRCVMRMFRGPSREKRVQHRHQGALQCRVRREQDLCREAAGCRNMVKTLVSVTPARQYQIRSAATVLFPPGHDTHGCLVTYS